MHSTLRSLRFFLEEYDSLEDSSISAHHDLVRTSHIVLCDWKHVNTCWRNINVIVHHVTPESWTAKAYFAYRLWVERMRCALDTIEEELPAEPTEDVDEFAARIIYVIDALRRDRFEHCEEGSGVRIVISLKRRHDAILRLASEFTPKGELPAWYEEHCVPAIKTLVELATRSTKEDAWGREFEMMSDLLKMQFDHVELLRDFS